MGQKSYLFLTHRPLPRYPLSLSLYFSFACSRKKEPRCVYEISAAPVIISTSGNSGNFGITRFKSNCRNSTECRFPASAADNTCRSSANQRKTPTSRQEASSQLPDLLPVFHRILSSRATPFPLLLPSRSRHDFVIRSGSRPARPRTGIEPAVKLSRLFLRIPTIYRRDARSPTEPSRNGRERQLDRPKFRLAKALDSRPSPRLKR